MELLKVLNGGGHQAPDHRTRQRNGIEGEKKVKGCKNRKEGALLDKSARGDPTKEAPPASSHFSSPWFCASGRVRTPRASCLMDSMTAVGRVVLKAGARWSRWDLVD